MSRFVSGNPLSRAAMDEERASGNGIAWIQSEISYRQAAKRIGLDKPAFYFTITHAARPDTFYRILRPHRKAVLGALTDQYGNWEQIQSYYNSITDLEYRMAQVPDTVRKATYHTLYKTVKTLSHLSDAREMATAVQEMNDISYESLPPALNTGISGISTAYQRMIREATPERTLLPAIYWHGTDNQYHDWITSLLSGHLGQSYSDSSVSVKIWQALKNTIPLSILAILLVYLISIPVGIWSALRDGSRKEKTVTLFLFLLYAIPAFWLATMCVVFLPGSITTGSGGMTAGQYAIPVICLALGSFAFLSRQMKASMKEALSQQYILTAKAKGLPIKKVIWRHAFRNAVFPLITLLASVLPATVAGSFVIEYVFNINGMGRLLVSATQQMDWPVVFAMVMLTALLTLTGNLLADMCYQWADPRVRMRKER